MNTITFRITGRSALMMCNNQTADPRNEYTKAIKELHTASRRKGADVESLLEKQSILRVKAGLYWNKELGLHLPAGNLRATFIDGAKIDRMGSHCSKYTMIAGPAKIKHPGSDDLEEIANDPRYRYDSIMKAGMVQVPTTRAIVPEWQCEFTINYAGNDKMTRADIIHFVEQAGNFIGVGASRKYGFGRFGVEVQDANGKYPKKEKSKAA
jgi:hypothetical protein|tara:strand:- start:267 stop:896 length:630 start_codon:yes stop_codon:yes gene_type:complete